MQEQEEQMYNHFSSKRLFFTGIAMGGADLIPGVSGGTIAFILGIYEALLSAIKSFNLPFISKILHGKLKDAFAMIPWRFIIALGMGIGVAIIGMASTMSYLLKNQRVYLFAFFFGLIIASIITVSRSVKWKLSSILSLLAGTMAGYAIVGLVPSEMPHEPLYLFFSGMVAIIAMILPGISGSFILLILGQYNFVLNAVKTFDVMSIIPVALGAVIGITAFSRLLSWMLKHYHALTIASLVGFMVGSLRRIWPWKETVQTMIDRHGEVVPIKELNVLPAAAGNEMEIVLAIALAVCGLLFLLYIDRLAKNS